jgi:hypothetical protein
VVPACLSRADRVAWDLASLHDAARAYRMRLSKATSLSAASLRPGSRLPIEPPKEEVKLRLMVDRRQALDSALANAHVEGADPSAETEAVMRAWADSTTSTAAQLGELAKLAAAGLPLANASAKAA